MKRDVSLLTLPYPTRDRRETSGPINLVYYVLVFLVPFFLFCVLSQHIFWWIIDQFIYRLTSVMILNHIRCSYHSNSLKTMTILMVRHSFLKLFFVMCPTFMQIEILFLSKYQPNKSITNALCGSDQLHWFQLMWRKQRIIIKDIYRKGITNKYNMINQILIVKQDIFV